MTKAELMEFVGKKVFVYFKDTVGGIYGTLGFADEFSAKHNYRKPGYFYINHTSFKVSHIRKVEADKGYDVEVITHGNCMMCGKPLTDGLFLCKECEDKASNGK